MEKELNLNYMYHAHTGSYLDPPMHWDRKQSEQLLLLKYA